MAEPHTLIIGDEIGDGLYDALQKIPGTGAIWRMTFPHSAILYWTAALDDLQDYLDKIAAGPEGGHAPSKGPDTAIVSLGRLDVLDEPTELDPKDAQKIADEVTSIVDKIQAQKLKVLWVLPPKIDGEGSIRDVIGTALAKKGVRVFPAQHSFSDPAVRGAKQIADIPESTYDQMAGLLATWAPLGGPRGSITERHPETISAPGYVANLSRPAKIGIGLAAIALLSGAAYAGWRRYG